MGYDSLDGAEVFQHDFERCLETPQSASGFRDRHFVVFLRLLENGAAMECYGSGCGLIQYPSGE